jgi:hypothetical protein
MANFDVGAYEYVPTLTEEHHDGTQVSYGSDIQWIGCRFYDHTNPIIAGSGSAFSFADPGSGLSNIKIRVCVAEEWRGGGLNATAIQTLKVLQSTFGNAPGSSSNTTSGDTIVVNLASPLVATSTKLCALAPPQGYLRGASLGSSSSNAFVASAAALAGALFAGHATHMTTAVFQEIDQHPSVGVYNYTYPGTGSNRSLYDGGNANLKMVKDSIAAVEAAGGGTDRMLIAFGCETWMNDGNTAHFPKPSHADDWIDGICDALIAGYTRNGNVPYWTSVGVFNEWNTKSRQNLGDPTGVGTAPPSGWLNVGLPTNWEALGNAVNPDTYTPNAPGVGVVSDTNYLQYAAYYYTWLYNKLADRLTAHAHAACNTVKLKGPHYSFGATNNENNHLYPLGDDSGSIARYDYDYANFVYWLRFAHRCEAITIDFSIVSNGVAADANTTYIVANYGAWGTLVRKVRALRDTYTSLAATTRVAPIEAIEFYADVNLSRANTNYTEPQQAMQKMLVMRELYVNGCGNIYWWHPQSDMSGSNYTNKESLWRETNVSTGTATSSNSITPAVSGGKLLAYDAAKLFVDNFPVSTQLYSVSCSNTNVVCMASASKVLAINTSGTSQNVTYFGVVRTLAPYDTAVYSANTGTTGSTLSDVIIDTGATGVTLRGVNARSQYYAPTAVAETAIDKNLWRGDWDRAGTNAKTGAAAFVSSTDLHLANSTQDAATGGPLPTEDTDILLWDADGRGYGANPSIGAYASPATTSPVFSGAVTAAALLPESGVVTSLVSGLASSTTYHYRVSAVRTDASGGTQVSSDMTFATQNATVVTTPSNVGPAITISPTSTVAGGTFVVKSDGKIYDSTGTTLQDFTSKAFNSLVTIKSDTAGTRRTMLPGLLNNAQFQAGLVLTELIGNDPTGNWEVKAPGTTYGIDMQGCSGRWGHARVVNYAHNGIGLNASAASIVCGATGTTWDTTNPDLRIDNFTFHAAGSADGSAVVANKARNVLLGGVDPGYTSSPTGLSGPAYLFNGAALDDVQDVRVGVALDGTPSYCVSKAATYTFHLLNQRRSGWQGQLNNPVLFVNTPGQRPEKPVWLKINGVSPGSETSGNTTNALVATDNPCFRDGIGQNLVGFTFRTGTVGNQAFEVDATVWDPAASLSSWSDTTPKFVDGRDPLGARVSGSATVLANKATIDSAFTVSGGAAGSVTRAGDGWVEVRGVKFDPGTPTAPIWTGTNVFTVDNKSGAQLKVAPAASQAGGVMPTIPVWSGSIGGGVDLKVTNPDGSTPADLSKWPIPPGGGEPIAGIRTNHADDLLGANAVETGVPYYRQLGYESYDAVNSKFKGVVLIPGPAGGAMNPEPGEVLSVTAANPGVVTTFFPHGMATNDQVVIAGNSQAAANGTFKVTRITTTTFSLQTTAGANVSIPSPGTGGTYTPKGPGGAGYTYGLVGTRSSGFQMVAGETLDSMANGNFGAPTHNASIFVATDATGVRFIGCDFFDVGVSAAGPSAKIQIVDCLQSVTPLYGKGIDYDSVDNGVRGTYDPNVMNDPPRMIGALNIIAPGEAFWLLERYKVIRAVGDIAPGKFAVGSMMRHCRWHHGSDARAPKKTASQSRSGMGFTNLPTADPGPHGDLYQNYDRNSITVVGCDLHTNAHSIWFSQAQFNYAVFASQTFDNFGGHYRFRPGTNHGFNVNDVVLITGTGDGTLDNHEFVVTQTNTDSAKNDVVLGGTTFVANRAGTATHVIHLSLDMRRNDIRTTKQWDTSDITDSTHVPSKGNVSVNQGNPWIANVVTMVAKFYDNRFDQIDSGNGSWKMATPAAGTSYDLGTPNRNLWRTYGKQGTAVPGGVASPTLS